MMPCGEGCVGEWRRCGKLCYYDAVGQGVWGKGVGVLNKNVGYHAWMMWKNCQLVLAKKNWVKKKH